MAPVFELLETDPEVLLLSVDEPVATLVIEEVETLVIEAVETGVLRELDTFTPFANIEAKAEFVAKPALGAVTVAPPFTSPPMTLYT